MKYLIKNFENVMKIIGTILLISYIISSVLIVFKIGIFNY